MDVLNVIDKTSERARTSLSSIIKIIIILAILNAIYFHLWHILFANTMLLILMFMPDILKKTHQIHIPKEFEFIVLIFVIATFFLGDIRGLIIQIFFGVSIGFIGFTMMLILYSNSKLKTNYALIILFAFSFSLALGGLLEMAKYYLKLSLGFELGGGEYAYTMRSLVLVALGSLSASLFGYAYMKGFRGKLLRGLVEKFKKKNPNLFITYADSPEEVLDLIKKGEAEKLEFKSTLRVNLHTNEMDKRVENAVLKTIVSFLNSEGGTLLVGVSDSGEISGIEKDKFLNNDKFNIHFANLIKEKIGKEFFPYIRSELVLINDKTILKVESSKSDKPVFLKEDKDEEFYIRLGPTSVQISGSKLWEYIKNNFKS